VVLRRISSHGLGRRRRVAGQAGRVQLHHIRPQIVTEGIGISPGAVEQPLHPIRRHIVGGLGQLPAVLTFHRPAARSDAPGAHRRGSTRPNLSATTRTVRFDVFAAREPAIGYDVPVVTRNGALTHLRIRCDESFMTRCGIHVEAGINWSGHVFLVSSTA
jgi:hypothetical protein